MHKIISFYPRSERSVKSQLALLAGQRAHGHVRHGHRAAVHRRKLATRLLLIMGDVRDILAGATAGTNAAGAASAAACASGEGITLTVGKESITFEAEDLLVETASAEGYACAESGGQLVALDTTLDDVLIREGIAREIVRTVQDGRKQAGLEVSDRIRLHVDGSALVSEALTEHHEWIMNETLTAEWSSTVFDTGFSLERELDDHQWQIVLEKTARG